MDSCLAIIPARGGSKRIPQKNIKSFCGQPIIKYSIDAAKKTNLFDEIMVSTDDTKIAQISKICGASVPFFRSANTSSDYALLADVVEEVLLEYEKIGKKYKFFCCILATAPLISEKRLLQAFERLVTTNADAVIPVVRFGFPIQRAFRIVDDRLMMMWPENLKIRSQDLENTYHDCGQFFWIKVDSFLKQKTFYAENTLAFQLPESEVQDIDVQEDWEIAEIKYCFLKAKGTTKKNISP